jgi:segregation and condensation protein B
MTPVEDLEALMALLAAAGLSAAKEKAEVEESDAEDSDDDEMSDDDDGSDGDDSDDDDSDDDDDDGDSDDEDEDDDDNTDNEDEEPEEVLEKAEVEELTAEPVETPVEVAAAPAAPVTDVVSPDHAQHLRLLEALVFAGTQALDEKELADRLPNDADVARLLADLAEMYANRGVNLVKVAGGYAFRTASDLSEKLKIERPVTRKLSRAAIETLAIIAYHQPVTRAEIEQVRGVGLSKGTLDLLFEQNWIKPMGRRRAPGKPVTWGTTDFFLEHFGLPSLDDLPGQEEMKAAGLLDPRAQPPIFRPEEPDLPLEPTEDEADEPLAVEEQKS